MPLLFFERPFPNANSIVVTGRQSILIDSGSGSDIAGTRDLLEQSNLTLPSLVVNTHYHSDHVGGNAYFQAQGIPIAAQRHEAQLVNLRDPEACAADWIGTDIEAYRVDRFLSEGDVLEAGDTRLETLATPGHTLGSLSFYARQERALIVGDLVHAQDVGWLNPFREGTGGALRAIESLERLLGLELAVAYSGHGSAITEPHATFRAAIKRYSGWLKNPERMAWHALKRLFGNALMFGGRLERLHIAPFLLSCPWFVDYTKAYFSADPAEMVQPLIDEMLRSGAADFQGEFLIVRTPYQLPPEGWLQGAGRPRQWARG